jgi:TonB family protein
MSRFRKFVLAIVGVATVGVCCADEPTPLKLSQCSSTGGGPFYPPSAQVRNIEGEVLIDFVIDSSGAPQSLRVVASDPNRVFDADALRMVGRLRCVVTPDWMSSAASQHRFRVRVYFQISRCVRPSKCHPPGVPSAKETGVDENMVVTGSYVTPRP